MNDNLLEVTVDDGKYTFIQKKDGSCLALRHGEQWKEDIFDNMVLSMAYRIQELEDENETLRKGLDAYKRERDRFRHAYPDISGAYFLAGGHGPEDDSLMPQFVEICPAYGAGWVKIYEDTGRTISYEGS